MDLSDTHFFQLGGDIGCVMEFGHDPSDFGEKGPSNFYPGWIRLIDSIQQRSSLRASALLGCLVVFGIFNRITFPAFILLPGLYLLPHFLRK